MDTQFLERVIPRNDGYFIMWAGDDRKYIPRPQQHPRHEASYRTAGVSYAERFLTHDKITPDHGIFFTPFTRTQKEWRVVAGRKRSPRFGDDLCLTCKLLWADIDVGEGKAYPDLKAALKAVLTVCDGVAMYQPSIVVVTGGGLHVYWVLDTPLDLGSWTDIAWRMRQFLERNGIRADHGVAIDHNRVLRMPGTVNRKLQDNPRECYRLDWDCGDIDYKVLDELLPARESVTSAQAERGTAETPIVGMAEYDGGMTGDAPGGTFHTAEIVQKCEVFKAIAADAGAGCTEPLWKDVLQTVSMTEDAQEWAHKLSSGHEGYDSAATDAKLAERSDHEFGIRCETYHQHYVDAGQASPCSTCPWSGRIKSPLGLGSERRKDPPPVHFPWGYELRESGVYQVGTGEEPATLVTRSVVRDAVFWRQLDRHGRPDDNYVKLTHDTNHRVVVTEPISFKSLTQGKAVTANRLQRERLLVQTDNVAARVKDFIMAWWKETLEQGRVPDIPITQGWVGERNNNHRSFLLGDTVYHADGSTETIPAVAEEGHHAITQYGTLENWQHAANVIIHDNAELACIVAGSFAAPLVDLIGNECAAMSCWSTDSGVGKTTALKVGAAVWGGGQYLSNTDDTSNGVVAKVGIHPNTPMLWDEVRADRTRRDVLELLFRMPMGMTKTRANRTGGHVPPIRFSTLGIVTSNQPLAGNMSGAGLHAQAMRLFEIQVPVLSSGQKVSNVDRLKLDSALDNHGWAGPIFIAYIVQHQKTLKDELIRARTAFELKAECGTPERMLARTAAVVFVAATIVNKLGLVTFDLTALFNRLLQGIKDQRTVLESQSEEYTALSNVFQFIAEHEGYRLARFTRQGGRHDEAPGMEAGIKGAVAFYGLATETGEVRIVRSMFRKWGEKNIDGFNMAAWDQRAARERLFAEEGHARKRVHIDNGQLPGSVRQWCIVVTAPELRRGGHLKDVSQSAEKDES